jgi:hypothetical protein
MESSVNDVLRELYTMCLFGQEENGKENRNGRIMPRDSLQVFGFQYEKNIKEGTPTFLL